MKIEIDTEQVWKVIESMLDFPLAQICRHNVICTVASTLFDDNGIYKDNKDYADFCKHVVWAHDFQAIEFMKKIRRMK